MKYILGIDGGGTKTTALVANIQGKILGKGLSGASNYQTVGIDRALESIKGASEDAVKAAGFGIDKFAVACFGLAGVGRETDRALMLPAIEITSI